VGESVENPLLYYENINALVYILQELQQKSKQILF
jgi:UDP-glucose 4-epimerase